MSQKKYLELKKQADKFTVSALVNSLGFEKTLINACLMLNNDEWDESLQEYATALLEELRKKHPEKWNSSWRYDALLGYAYHIILKYDERYAAYKRAFEKIHPTPPQLLIAMARCAIAPGEPPITEREAISLVKQAMQDTLYIEGAELLRGLYKSLGNIEEQRYWENVLKNIKETGHHLPSLDQISTCNQSYD